MADMSAEPSMEDILSSIKRIIAEEGDAAVRKAAPGPQTAAQHALQPAPVAQPAPPHAAAPAQPEILELSEPMPAMQPGDGAAAPIASPQTLAATRGALDHLSRVMVRPEPGSDGTLEGLVREMLRPMLRDWLDANLPAIVETMVAREVERITQGR